MAIAGKLLEGLNGTLGPVVGSSWRGQGVLKSRPTKKKNRVFSEAQLDQQAKFRAIVDHLQNMSEVVATTFTGVTGRKTPINVAVSRALNEALTGTYPDYSIDWAKLQVSDGKLLPAMTSSAIANGANIQFTWSTEIPPKTSPRDKVIFVVYCPSLQTCFYELAAFTRSLGTAQVNVSYFAGKVVHTYIGFITEDRKRASTSKYTGEFTV
jgi:hypothetical protein